MKRILFTLLTACLLIGCSAPQETSEPKIQTDPEAPTSIVPAELSTEDQAILDEFNQHKDLFEDDVVAAKTLGDEEYLDHAAKQIDHLNAFYMFFQENQNTLKDLNIDTFKWNNNIVDTSEDLKSRTAKLGYPIE